MKYLIILFIMLVIVPPPVYAIESGYTREMRRNQVECVKEIKKELNYPTHKAVRYCNGGQM